MTPHITHFPGLSQGRFQEFTCWQTRVEGGETTTRDLGESPVRESGNRAQPCALEPSMFTQCFTQELIAEFPKIGVGWQRRIEQPHPGMGPANKLHPVEPLPIQASALN